MKKYNNGEFTIKDENKYVELFGWVQKRRDMGGVIFADLRDRSGLIQVVFNRAFLKDNFEIAESLKNEYCIRVEGKVIKRTPDMINPKLKTGALEVMVEKLEILSESDPLPFNIYEEEDANENIALKYRYLQLRKPKYKEIFNLRHQVCRSIREYLDNLGFMEIETPILCKSTPEGARDYLVPSRITKGSFYALPQSPQIFKQLLMIAGFEKYYQIAKCFRDEDLRADRQPEFTQIDLEMSFATEQDVWEVAEGMIKHVVKQTKGIDLEDFPKITYDEAMSRYGSDKPDTRFEMELNDLTEILRGTQMNVFNSIINENGLIKCLIVKDNADKYSRSDVEHMTDFVKQHGAHGLAWLKYDNDAFNGVIAKNIEEEKLNQIKLTYKVSNNDLILIVAGKKKIVNQSLGALRIKIAKELKIIPENKLNFLWVTNFPMFEYSETENRWMAAHHPFTMPDDVEKMNDPENCYSRAYDIVVNGYELASGSVRIHDRKIQAKVFDALGISKEEAKNRFGFFLEAFQYGAPPHAGIAPGIDRLIMILANTDNIKDVQAFPKIQSASDLMNESPSEVSEKQLIELGLQIVKDEENE